MAGLRWGCHPRGLCRCLLADAERRREDEELPSEAESLHPLQREERTVLQALADVGLLERSVPPGEERPVQEVPQGAEG